MREREESRFDNVFVSNVGGTETAPVMPAGNAQLRRSKENDPREGLLNNLVDDMR